VSARSSDTLAPRSERAPRSSDVDVDVVIIGGGVNGTGVARDAAMRGFRVALFERNDLAFGASGNSSGMIHGGVRYLTSAPEVTKASCTDSGYIQAIAPHLLFRIPFLVPVLRGRFSKALVPLMDGFFEAYDRYQPLKRGKPHARLTPDEVRALEPGIVGDVVAGFTFDEWGIDGARLCTVNAVDAIERGARVEVGVTVERLERDGPVWRATLRNRHDGTVSRIRASAVVNASGAWAPITAALSGVTPARARVRPGKGIHVVFDRRLSNYAISGRAIDGRQIFLEPWQNVSVLGTTDDDYYGDLDRVRASSEEARYLVEGMALLFPDIRKARAIGTYAGVRPTLYSFGPTEDALSRDHRIVDHAADGAPSLFTMIGGKLASYRVFAEEMVDLLVPSPRQRGSLVDAPRAPARRRRGGRPARARGARGARAHRGQAPRLSPRQPLAGAGRAHARAPSRGVGRLRVRARARVRGEARGEARARPHGGRRGPPHPARPGRVRRACGARRAAGSSSPTSEACPPRRGDGRRSSSCSSEPPRARSCWAPSRPGKTPSVSRPFAAS
jgi:glycerol-3-phosphate dehydrogenase